jgi:MoaA/NifB/PqqE/SkfB family radical SAM enzyme
MVYTGGRPMDDKPSEAAAPSKPMIDGFGRHITYVRMSVTDRCDLRCRYCMAERMSFLPKKDVLSLEEIVELADILISRGVKRIRLTGGEPLVRKGVGWLVAMLGQRIGNGLDELTMTTNGTQLAGHARHLFDCGIRRINVSLDSRDPERFRHITRGGDSATSPAVAMSRRFSPASKRRHAPASRSRSTWSRSRTSTRMRSRRCFAGAPARATT